MKRDSKLSIALHALLHMAKSDRPLTSEELGDCLQTNPVVVRRTLAGLRDRGHVTSVKGHGGGWSIACDLEDIKLGDIYNAVGEPTVFAMGNRTESPGCAVEQAVNRVLDSALRDAEALLMARLHSVSLADLAVEIKDAIGHCPYTEE